MLFCEENKKINKPALHPGICFIRFLVVLPSLSRSDTTVASKERLLGMEAKMGCQRFYNRTDELLKRSRNQRLRCNMKGDGHYLWKHPKGNGCVDKPGVWMSVWALRPELAQVWG